MSFYLLMCHVPLSTRVWISISRAVSRPRRLRPSETTSPQWWAPASPPASSDRWEICLATATIDSIDKTVYTCSAVYNLFVLCKAVARLSGWRGRGGWGWAWPSCPSAWAWCPPRASPWWRPTTASRSWPPTPSSRRRSTPTYHNQHNALQSWAQEESAPAKYY